MFLLKKNKTLKFLSNATPPFNYIGIKKRFKGNYLNYRFNGHNKLIIIKNKNYKIKPLKMELQRWLILNRVKNNQIYLNQCI